MYERSQALTECPWEVAEVAEAECQTATRREREIRQEEVGVVVEGVVGVVEGERTYQTYQVAGVEVEAAAAAEEEVEVEEEHRRDVGLCFVHRQHRQIQE